MAAKEALLVFVVLGLLLICSARPRDFYLKKNGNYLRRFLKSFAIGRDELFCPRVIRGSNTVSKKTETRPGCGPDFDLCSDNRDCGPGLMCCPSGCIYKCVIPEQKKVPVATDWIEEPEALTVGGSSWLIEGEDPGPSRDIECSTSLFPDIEPLRCMHGYTCKIQIEEDKVNQIPNSGICVKSNSKDSSDILNNLAETFAAMDTSVRTKKGSSCILNGKQVPHGYHDVMDCNSCFCKDGELFCQVQLCLTKK